ncbi:MAG: hypothetical protein ABIR80_06540, partial [Opitutaceae bacterium]
MNCRLTPSPTPFAIARLLAVCIAAPLVLLGEFPEQGTNPPETKTATATNSVTRSRTIADLNLELLWVQPGKFTMGSAPDEALRNKAEG